MRYKAMRSSRSRKQRKKRREGLKVDSQHPENSAAATPSPTPSSPPDIEASKVESKKEDNTSAAVAIYSAAAAAIPSTFASGIEIGSKSPMALPTLVGDRTPNASAAAAFPTGDVKREAKSSVASRAPIDNKAEPKSSTTGQKCADVTNWVLRSTLVSTSTKILTLATYAFGFFNYFPTIKTTNNVVGIVNTLLDHAVEHANHEEKRKEIDREKRAFDRYKDAAAYLPDDSLILKLPTEKCWGMLSNTYGLKNNITFLSGVIALLNIGIPIVNNILLLTDGIDGTKKDSKYITFAVIGGLNMVIRWLDEYWKHHILDGHANAYREAFYRASLGLLAHHLSSVPAAATVGPASAVAAVGVGSMSDAAVVGLTTTTTTTVNTSTNFVAGSDVGGSSNRAAAASAQTLSSPQALILLRKQMQAEAQSNQIRRLEAATHVMSSPLPSSVIASAASGGDIGTATMPTSMEPHRKLTL
jgi:hypothetical protein